MSRWLDIASAVAALIAAVFWFLSASGKMPPMVAYYDQTPASDPFYKTLVSSANVNQWAAAFSGISAFCAGIKLFLP